MPRPLVLASASPARLGLLRSAGLCPVVEVSGVDEDEPGGLSTADLVLALAQRKAAAVAARPVASGALVLGCDSLLDVDGVGHGKPAGAAEALARWRALRGRAATLHTGHCLVDAASGATASGVASTVVHFGSPGDDELEAYVATGEPLAVAGGFTLDGRSAPFVERIEGDHGNVIGLSLPLLRTLLGRLGVRIVDLWC